MDCKQCKTPPNWCQTTAPPYAMMTSIRKFAPNAPRFLIAVILAMAAFACTSPPAPEPTATPNIEATITAAVAAALPTATPTPTPTSTPTPDLPATIAAQVQAQVAATIAAIAPTWLPTAIPIRTPTPLPVSTGPIPNDPTRLTAGGKHTCQIQTDATVLCWGADDRGQSTPPSGEFVSVTAGGEHTCGITANNAMQCWGANDSEQIDAPDGEFTSIDAGRAHSCALQADGTAVCWGKRRVRPAGRSRRRVRHHSGRRGTYLRPPAQRHPRMLGR